MQAPVKGMARAMLWRILILCATAIGLTLSGYSQMAGTGSIQGTVTDNTGAVIQNASVTVVNSATQVKHAVKTDENGLYSVPNLPVGIYVVDVTAPGFANFKQSTITLEVGSSIAVNVRMNVGTAQSTTVEVRASALSLQTEDTSFKQTVDQNDVMEMPLNGRQMTSLITLAGAAAPAAANDIQGSKNFYSSVVISVAGGMGNQTDYQLDGGDNNDYMTNINLPFPFPDAVSQFSVESTDLGAQQGLHSGGFVNVVTRSGSNQWHGSAFEFIRNNYIDATNFFASTKDTLHQNQFGGTVGGKAIRDKLFFFGGYQRLKADQKSSSASAVVPTQANLSGDFSTTDGAACLGSFNQLLDPHSGAVLTNNQINPSGFDKSALALAKYLPTPYDSCGDAKYAIPYSIWENQIITRVDGTINQKNSFYGRYFLDGYTHPAFFSPTDILVTNSSGNYERVQTLTLADTYVINSRTVNTFHATGTRRRINRGPAPGGINAGTIGINMYAPAGSGLGITTSKWSAYQGGVGAHFDDNMLSFADDVNLVRGKHQIAFGGEYIRNQLNIINGYQAYGQFNFNGTFSKSGPAGVSTGGGSGDSNLDFLTGAMSSFSQSGYQQNALRAPIPSLYAADTFHVTSRFVLSAGVRWEPEFWPVDYFGRGSVFNNVSFLDNQHSQVYPNAPAGIFFYGDKGVPKAFTGNSPWQFSPRLGLTYDPKGDGKMVVRVGAGLVYDMPNFFTGQRVQQNPPYATDVSNTPVGQPLVFSAPWSNGAVSTNPFPLANPPTPATAVFPKGSQYIIMPPHFRTQYTTQWTASVQRNFARGWQAQIDYIGNKSSFVAFGYPINPAVYTSGSPTANYSSRFRLTLENPTQGPMFSGGGNGSPSLLATAGANANFNAMVATIQHRLSSTFSLLANYTWSHCLDVEDAQGDLNGTTVENPDNIDLDRANCGFDYRHIINASVVAKSHFSSFPRPVGLIVNDWEIAPLMRITDGAPFTMLTGEDQSGTDIGEDRPNIVPGQKIYTGNPIRNSAASASYNYINGNAFTPQAVGTYGNVGRNSLRGPKYFELDTALSRFFPIHDRLTLDLRLEAFNMPNHPDFGNPVYPWALWSTIGAGYYAGWINSQTNGARIFQGAAKIIF
jgi:hypothetical protein